MSQNRQDFEINANSAKTVYFALTDGTNALDLTNVPLRWRLADSINAAEAVLEKTSSSNPPGIVVSNPSAGLCQVSIADTDIAGYGLYWHMLQGNLNGGGYVTLSQGRVVVNPTIAAAS